MPDPIQPAGAVLGITGLSYGALTPDSRSAIVNYGGGSDTLRQVDLATGQVITSWQVGINIVNVDVTPDGRYALAVEAQSGAGRRADLRRRRDDHADGHCRRPLRPIDR